MADLVSAAGWVALGIGVGAYGTLIGAGGGFILVPALLLLYPHLPPTTLTAISLAAVFFNAVSGSLSYARLRRIDYRSGLVLAAATIPGAVVGALLVGGIRRQSFNLLFGLVLILLSVLLLLRPSGSRPLWLDAPFTVQRTITDSDGQARTYRFNLALAAAFSVLLGFVSSLLGIGGGIFQVPLLTTFFSFPAHIATATAQFVLLFTSVAGVVTHIVQGAYQPYLGLTLELAVGVLLGAQAGAALSRRVTGTLIIRLLAVALALAGLRLLIGGLNLG